jgi:cellulose synthase/poly-beta-1,6-N-acetylglucosamine synthase-like glycosyltransferase
MAILLFIPVYIILSFESIFFSSAKLESIIFNILLLAVEIFGFIFVFYLAFMISGAISFRIKSHTVNRVSNISPFFSIIVPSHGTNFLILKNTLDGAQRIKYEKFEIIVSDNSKNEIVASNLKDYCQKNEIVYHYKKDERGFKAGNINAVLSLAKGEYIVILDSDHIPDPKILQNFARSLGKPRVGFIQAKAVYRNTRRLYQAASSILYAQFYEVIEAAKDQRGMVLFNGTTEIGGFSEDTLIEDIDTSIKILTLGYEGRFANFIGSYGLAPESAKSQITRLWRWTHGACNILRIRLRMLLFNKKISWPKKFELILNTMAFFSGISIVVLFSMLTFMNFLQISVLRFKFLGLNSVFIMPMLTSLFILSMALLTILWEEREISFFQRLVHLIPFYLFSLGTFLFLISGIIDGLLLKNTPKSETSVWDREFKIVRNSLLALAFTGILVLLTILAAPNELTFFIIGGVITWIFTPGMLIWEEIKPHPRE